MSYTPPAGNAANVSWVGAVPYTAPTGNTASVSWASGAPAAVTGAGSGAVSISGSGIGEHHEPLPAVTGVGHALFQVGGAAAGVHGVAGTGAGVLPVIGAAGANHGVAGSGSGAIALPSEGVGRHPRYELRGEVRLGGILVNRRVRAYLRSSGAMLGEADTVAGRFRVHAGFEAAECYVTPIDMDPGATDWRPPTANRIASVLASDIA